MTTEEYNLLDGRTIRVKYDRLGMCKLSGKNMESFVKEFNASYRQAKILEKIKKNYGLLKLEEEQKKENLKNEFKERYPKNYMGEPELGGRSCVFSLNEVLEIIDRHLGNEEKGRDCYNEDC